MAKAQIQMMETIAILLVFFILLTIGILFYAQFQKGEIQGEQQEVQAERSIDAALLALDLPELRCSERNVKEGNCVDIPKLEIVPQLMRENAEYYFDIFGSGVVSVTQIFPGQNHWVLYNNTGNTNRKIVTTLPILLKDPLNSAYAYGVMTIETTS